MAEDPSEHSLAVITGIFSSKIGSCAVGGERGDASYFCGTTSEEVECPTTVSEGVGGRDFLRGALNS